MAENMLSNRPDYGRTFNTAMWLVGLIASIQLFAVVWAVFAKTGDPNGAGPTKWRPYHATSDEHLVMDTTLRMAAGLRAQACDLLDRILRNRRGGSPVPGAPGAP